MSKYPRAFNEKLITNTGIGFLNETFHDYSVLTTASILPQANQFQSPFEWQKSVSENIAVMDRKLNNRLVTKYYKNVESNIILFYKYNLSKLGLYTKMLM